MPTPEEIKKAIREYALNNGSALCPASCIDYVINDFIEQLSKDYFIVEKSKARELQQIVTDNADSIDHGLIDGLSDWVEINLGSLFEEGK